jgi:hypothetical protein
VDVTSVIWNVLAERCQPAPTPSRLGPRLAGTGTAGDREETELAWRTWLGALYA